MTEIYDQLNKAWKSTCRILFKEEIGELEEYKEWLKEYLPKFQKRKSHISGKEVTFAHRDYCSSANFVSLDEAKEKAAPLSINEIKDIDAILMAISERWEYAGNKALGNSMFVEDSDNVINSQYVADSVHIRDSSKVFSSYFVNDSSKYVFGCNWLYKSEFVIKSASASSKRCLEANWIDKSSDLYYCFYCLGCHDLMFSFSQRNKKYCIGNLELPKDKYLDLKQKLLKEICSELKRDHTFPSLFDLVPNEEPKIDIQIPTKPIEGGDMGSVNKAFSSTFKILFKKEAVDVTQYEGWLSKHILQSRVVVSPFGTKTYGTDVITEILVYPEKRLVAQHEGLELSKLHLDESNVGSLSDIKENVSDIGFFLGDVSEMAKNAIDCPIAFHVQNMYKVNDGSFSQNCAADGQVIDSKYVFGSNRVSDSEFCINCYSSTNLSRCFEMDTCTNCFDSYFAHNCEGLQNAMFCWNAKGKRYAIGNTQLPPEQYRKIKDTLVQQMADEILKKKELKWDIFNIGCYGRA